MKILKTVNRVPGGLMVVPLFLGMFLNTFFPDLLRIGGFTQALTGSATDSAGCTFHSRDEDDVSRRPPHAAARWRFCSQKVGTATLFASPLRTTSRQPYSSQHTCGDGGDEKHHGGMFLALTSVMGTRKTRAPMSFNIEPGVPQC